MSKLFRYVQNEDVVKTFEKYGQEMLSQRPIVVARHGNYSLLLEAESDKILKLKTVNDEKDKIEFIQEENHYCQNYKFQYLFYMYEYNELCYDSCPKRTKASNNNICELLNCRNYYNYEETDCLDKIEDGYYSYNPSLKTINKCNKVCKKIGHNIIVKNLSLTLNEGDILGFIGQNGADSIATITALLDAGTDTANYVFGSGTLAANGTGSVLASASGKTLNSGTYDAFAIIFDSASPKAGESKYVVVSGAANLHKVIADTTATVMFATGSAASIVNNADNWKSYGAVPEPTSGLLMLLGMAGLALRRKRA